MAKKEKIAASGPKTKYGPILTVLFTIISLLWISPIFEDICRIPQLYKCNQQDWFLQSLRLFVIHHGRFSRTDRPVLLHVRVVHYPRPQQGDEGNLPAMPLLDDRSVPDGHVHTVQVREHAASVQPGRHRYCVSGIRSRPGHLYVHRICQEHSTRDRRGRNDRWLHTDPDIFPGRIPDHEADRYHGRDPGRDVDLERLPAPVAGPQCKQV